MCFVVLALEKKKNPSNHIYEKCTLFVHEYTTINHIERNKSLLFQCLKGYLLNPSNHVYEKCTLIVQRLFNIKPLPQHPFSPIYLNYLFNENFTN